MSQENQSFGQGVAFVLVATLGWSLSGLFVRWMPGLNGWQINCWRGLWMSAALFIYLLIAYRGNVLSKFKSIPLYALIMSSVCFAAGTTFYVTSLTLVGTATVSVIGATSPLFTGLLSPWITGEKPGLIAWVSAFLALCGMVVIGYHSMQVGNYFGLATSIGVPVMFALQTLLLRRYRGFDMMPAFVVGGVLIFMVAGFCSWLSDPVHNAYTIDQHSFVLLMLMGPLQLAIPLVFYGKGAKSVSAISLALISMLDAVFNPLWPWIFVHEVPDFYSLLGGAIILGAVLLSVLEMSMKSRKPVNS
jgi:drug/metabolite transporter (DMT)-like permease